MKRRKFIKTIPVLSGLLGFSAQSTLARQTYQFTADRECWVDLLYKISYPVLHSMSEGKLKEKMPVETSPGGYSDRETVTYLEALGRTLAGVAPWLALEDLTGEEKSKQDELRAMALLCLQQAVDPDSPDYINWTEGNQPLVDGAFLVHGLMRAPKVLWEPLDSSTKERLIAELIAQKTSIKPYYSNWLLFGAMIDAFLFFVGKQGDMMRIDFAVKKHQEWYLGDGWYGDGPEFHLDFYNGFVIQPMLIQVLEVASKIQSSYSADLQVALKRMQRFARQQELMISPEGTFPPMGRSIAYRSGAFQPLGEVIIRDMLPQQITHGQVRAALSGVYAKLFEAEGTFDENGWLRLGLVGHQPNLAEPYISTGSLYLCTLGFLPLGLSPSHEFWTSGPEDWTSKKIWQGANLKRDEAIK